MASSSERLSVERSRVEATVAEVLPQSLFRLRLKDGRVVTAHLASEFRVRCVRIVPGDRVVVELSACDGGRGRILERR